MFVGDSIQRGQWMSFVCMVESVIPDDEKLMVKHNRSHLVFIAKVYFIHHSTSLNSQSNNLLLVGIFAWLVKIWWFLVR